MVYKVTVTCRVAKEDDALKVIDAVIKACSGVILDYATIEQLE